MTGELIRAVKKDQELLREMDALINDQDRCDLWWLGQSGFLLQWNGNRILIDPYLSDSLTEKYAATDKPHVRMSERVIDPQLLHGITIVSSSHNHTDHLDADTLIPVLQNNPAIQLIIPEANRNFVSERLKCEIDFPVGLSDGQSARLGAITIHGIPAKHNEIERDEKGFCKYMGYVFEFGNYKIYHSGDTLWFEGMENILRPFLVDVAILPVNGNEVSRRVAGNLDCREAAELGRAIGAKCVIPCHYDMFAFNTADVSDFEKEAKKINQPYIVLRGGGHFSIVNNE